MLKDFVDHVERAINTAAAKGSCLEAIYVCPAGEQTLMEENMKTPHKELDLLPELRIHGVPIRVAKGMRQGRFFYLLRAA